MAILRALIEASRQIGDKYFLLTVAYKDRPIKRERVYCYELYHQLRVALHGIPLTLTGEPDKRGHTDFTNKQPNPDFILHTPGHHADNMAVIEVECRLNRAHLTKDLKTLKLMKGKGYRVLVLLLFAAPTVPWRHLESAAAEAEMELGDVVVLLHRAAGEAATREYPPTRGDAAALG
jgi:hypothetical protein